MNYAKRYFENIQKALMSVPSVSALNGKRILITGATGLIGSAVTDTLIYLVENLKLDIEIYAASRKKEALVKRFKEYAYKNYFFIMEYDATQELLFSDIKFDYILHCASNAHPHAYSKEPVETMLCNLIGLNNLLKYSVEYGVKRLLYVSSSEIYGNKADNMLYKEDDICDLDILSARACYPSSKRAAETLCICYKEEYGIDTVIVRPGHIYGPTMTKTDSRASAEFFRACLLGHGIVMKSPGEQLRSYCYVFDCVSAMLCVLIHGISGEAYNISNPNSIVSIRDLAKEIAAQTGTQIVFARPTQEERKSYNMMMCSALDSTKLEKLGWKGQFSLYEGVRETLALST